MAKFSALVNATILFLLLTLNLGMVQLDKSLCQSHDATQVRKGLSRPESRGGSVSQTERYTSLSSTEKHGT
jgi:hypothetical protein